MVNYTSNKDILNQQEKTISQMVFKNIVPIISIIVVIANLWLATKLSSLVERISILEVKVVYAEESNNNNREMVMQLYKELETRLIRIENKIDAYIIKD